MNRGKDDKKVLDSEEGIWLDSGMAHNDMTPDLAMFSIEGDMIVHAAVLALLPRIDRMGRKDGLPDQWTFADMLHNEVVLMVGTDKHQEHGDTSVRESAYELVEQLLVENFGWERV